jgi:integrase
MLICGISMALRATELVSLNVGDVRDTNGQIKTYVTIRPETAKFEKKRKIRIGEKVKSALKGFIEYKRSNGESIEDDAPLFVSRKRRPASATGVAFGGKLACGHMTRQALFALMRKIFDAAGIDESCHALRKTGATAYYVESNYDLLATQDFLEEMTNSLKRYSDNDLLIELQKRGHDVSEILRRIHQQEFLASKVVNLDAAKQVK